VYDVFRIIKEKEIYEAAKRLRTEQLKEISLNYRQKRMHSELLPKHYI